MLYQPGDKCATVGNTMNCSVQGRIVTIRKHFIEGGIDKYIVKFEDGYTNYDIEGSPGYVLREHEMEPHDYNWYEVDE